jgi:hypothetical protein
MPSVDVTHEPAPNRLHHARHPVGIFGRCEQVDVVRHQDVRVNLAAESPAGVAEQAEITAKLVDGAKRWRAIMTALDDVRGHFRNNEPTRSGHSPLDSIEGTGEQL